MDVKDRNRLKKIIKLSHERYLASLTAEQLILVNLENRFSRIRKDVSDQLRKEYGSENSVKLIPRLSQNVFGLHEDMIRLSLPLYEFEKEIEVINNYIIEFLERKRKSKYSGECQYYGETLLNIYLDIFISLTCPGTLRNIEHKPGYLVNPKSGQLLELDISLEDFKLAFEFQGETHYTDEKDMEKDSFKLEQCARNKVILIPVNIFQLNSVTLMELIVNSIKDAIAIHSKIAGESIADQGPIPQTHHRLMSFKKACQRIYLAKLIFSKCLIWIDEYALRFVDTQRSRNPISSSSEAPRLVKINSDMDIEYIYRRLKMV
ncbi:MAG: hypothetical protein A2076_07165 [Geobacteraceae bacterium GWC2_53_11]|nr:MAG: hypothetical protein A2076_07165 [Geobacteraceae bacterium GWC2_53_11]